MTTASASRPGRANPWIVVTAFAVLTFLVSGALLTVQPISGIDPAALSLVQFGPGLAAVLTWAVWRRRLTGLLPTAIPWSATAARLAVMVGLCLLCTAVVAGAAWAAGADPAGFVSVGGVSFALLLLLQLIGACGEEIGWRGLAQPVLEPAVGRLPAVLVTGLVWAPWHVHAFAAGPVIALSFLLSTLCLAVLFGCVGAGSPAQRILVATLGHWLVNIGLYVVSGDRTLEYPQVLYTVTGAVTVVVVSAVAGAVARKPLSARPGGARAR